MDGELEDRYLVLKLSDVREALDTKSKNILLGLTREVFYHRVLAGKEDLKAIVIEDDWPEYEPTKKLLLDRVRKEQSNETR